MIAEVFLPGKPDVDVIPIAAAQQHQRMVNPDDAADDVAMDA